MLVGVPSLCKRNPFAVALRETNLPSLVKTNEIAVGCACSLIPRVYSLHAHSLPSSARVSHRIQRVTMENSPRQPRGDARHNIQTSPLTSPRQLEKQARQPVAPQAKPPSSAFRPETARARIQERRRSKGRLPWHRANAVLALAVSQFETAPVYSQCTASIAFPGDGFEPLKVIRPMSPTKPPEAAQLSSDSSSFAPDAVQRLLTQLWAAKDEVRR